MGDLPFRRVHRHFFHRYTGPYTFDGTDLITCADTASAPDLLVDQIRRIRFDSETRMVMEAEQRCSKVVRERVT